MDIKQSSDQPIQAQSDDRFQRYDFAKRIAQTINERASSDCIVLGIYGAWGEGKTSVLNFIAQELKVFDGIITIKFNPWRYSDENTLLGQFFEKLAAALDSELKSTSEKIGTLFSNYSKFLNVPFVADLSGTGEALGKLLGVKDVEALKDRISTIIKENGKKIVVFIDDIDRLDKTEIHTIFRLVKLTGDFANTTYILSFDHEMVSAAIGERFGEGNKASGMQFLEKIIQIPLQIPLAQPLALQKYFITMLNNLLDANKIDIDGNEGARFYQGFQNAVLTKLDTPRLAVRYANTLSFSIPLLQNEANIVDLLLIEAVKIFYPAHYRLIRENPDYFIGNYHNSYDSKLDQQKVDKILEHLKAIGADLNDNQYKGIENLLTELFPYLKQATNMNYHSYHDENRWYLEKRAASPYYFNRYFSYAVIEGDVSDVLFENFQDTFTHLNEVEQIASVKELIEQNEPTNFIRKLRSKEGEYMWKFAYPLAKAIARNSSLLKKKSNSGFFEFLDAYGQSAILISKLIESNPSSVERSSLVEDLLSMDDVSLKYSFEIVRWIKVVGNEEQKLFTKNQILGFLNIILMRALKFSNKSPLYEAFPDEAYKLFSIWHETDPGALLEYVKKFLQSESRAFIKLLYALTPKIIGGEESKTNYSDFRLDSYKYVTNMFGEELIKDQILANYTIEELQGRIVWDSHTVDYQSELNLVSQYMHHYYNSQE